MVVIFVGYDLHLISILTGQKEQYGAWEGSSLSVCPHDPVCPSHSGWPYPHPTWT